MENVLINYFIQINGTRQNKDNPQQREAAVLCFQSHALEETTLPEQTLLTGLHAAGTWMTQRLAWVCAMSHLVPTCLPHRQRQLMI